MRYLLMMIGCLECGIPSQAVKLFPTLLAAQLYVEDECVVDWNKVGKLTVGNEPIDGTGFWSGQERWVLVDLGVR